MFTHKEYAGGVPQLRSDPSAMDGVIVHRKLVVLHFACGGVFTVGI
jgi:hypothetical protein